MQLEQGVSVRGLAQRVADRTGLHYWDLSATVCTCASLCSSSSSSSQTASGAGAEESCSKSVQTDPRLPS